MNDYLNPQLIYGAVILIYLAVALKIAFEVRKTKPRPGRALLDLFIEFCSIYVGFFFSIEGVFLLYFKDFPWVAELLEKLSDTSHIEINDKVSKLIIPVILGVILAFVFSWAAKGIAEWINKFKSIPFISNNWKFISVNVGILVAVAQQEIRHYDYLEAFLWFQIAVVFTTIALGAFLKLIFRGWKFKLFRKWRFRRKTKSVEPPQIATP